jgi:mannose-6-phosphate isomerase-like protein (cupin superfamily)
MGAAPRVIDPVVKYAVSFERRGDALVGDFTVEPGGGGLAAHTHPRTEERFDVRGGMFRFRIGRDERTASAGEQLTVPAGTLHAFRNVGPVPGRVVVEMEPAGQMQGLFEEVAALAAAGRWTVIADRAAPTGPIALLEMAELLDRYQETIVMASPPRWLQRAGLPILARLQRRRGSPRSR